MDKRIIIVIVVVLVLVLGTGAYVMFANKTSQEPTPTPLITQDQHTANNSQQEASLKELLAAGKPQECTYSDIAEGVNVSGTVRVTSSKMRGDFDSLTNGQTIKSHMIIDDKTMYIWTDGQPQGFKMSLDTIASPNASAKAQGNVDVDKKINYSCNSWSVDTSVFTIPTGITFQDFSQLTAPTIPGATGSSNSSQCATCNSLDGDAKAQCLKALSCN